MMISNLPRDLVEDIVSRVPLKSMRAVQLTCREWNTLSKSPTFTKMHLGKASAAKKGESLMIVMMNYNLYLISVSINKDVDPFTEHKGKLNCLDEQVKISKVFDCEGLLLCILKDDDTKVVVWNPYLAQTRWIELRYSLRPLKMDYFSYALGYTNNKSCRSYKFLRFVDVCLFEPNNKFSWYEIYDFDSDSWTTLDVDITPYWRMACHRGVSLKGNTYWCVSKGYEDHVEHIICFDYTRERFGPLHSLPFTYGKRFAYLSCVREEKLAVLLLDEEDLSCFEIWITTVIEAENVSWNKFLKVATTSYPYTWFSLGGFLIDEMKKVAVLFKRTLDCYKVEVFGETGSYLRQVDLKECTVERCVQHMVSCVPSLVQIKQPKGGQRKNQSDLEKLRYDQYMLRLSLFISRCIKLADRDKNL